MIHLFLLMILIFSFLFIFLNHPMSMNTNLMFQTFFISIFSGLLIKTFWFSYSLFLIFLGGMLILIMYMTSVASNEKFSMKYYFYNTYKFLFIIILFFFIMNFNYMMINKINSMETLKIYQSFFLDNNNSMNFILLNKLYNFPTNFLSIFLIIYLLITLIACVKISNSNKSPMRNFKTN
uniref:NADH dehydrogenase subunit 6 n=1 Tax=Stenochironomus tobaduodecimus TaxID=1636530 RepID=UPI001FAE832F|nr:NADH dehydrogenase subunit 6 [Stenochironomus tobaduodecimus]UKO33043.1 NADH dehydrogenase subunit 6 [Stenochironomus tobaduodecimus]